ncbi:gamma subclass chorismate mutase AroQ [Pseudomonas sp.]|uniref:gamma subclass chorismate mutase AroQ n=1 Tax=Pseudomonas sp. TaxID=306 RepID=UPI003D6E4542
MRILLLVPLLTPLFLVQGCSPSTNDRLQQLLDTVEQRLNFAEPIALSKWHSGQPVEDNSREASVIASAKAQASNFKLDSQRAAEFMDDQIQANKLLQYYALVSWLEAGSAPQAARADLAQLRPQLDRLQETMLSALAEFDRNPPEPCLQVLDQAINQRESNSTRVMALRSATAHLCFNE